MGSTSRCGTAEHSSLECNAARFCSCAMDYDVDYDVGLSNTTGFNWKMFVGKAAIHVILIC